MIHDSWPWRADLLRDANVLRRWKDRPLSVRRGFLIEKKIFTAAYVMRKMMESMKNSTNLQSFYIRCTTYPCLNRPTWYDRWEWYEHYDLEKPSRTSISVKDTFDLVIHSLIFTEFVKEDYRSNSFLVTSDRRRETALWEIEIEAYIELMERVARDNPTLMRMRFDHKKGDWISWRGHGDPPTKF